MKNGHQSEAALARPSVSEVTDKMAAVTTADQLGGASAPSLNVRTSQAGFKRARCGVVCSSAVRPAEGERKRVEGEKERSSSSSSRWLRRCCAANANAAAAAAAALRRRDGGDV